MTSNNNNEEVPSTTTNRRRSTRLLSKRMSENFEDGSNYNNNKNNQGQNKKKNNKLANGNGKKLKMDNGIEVEKPPDGDEKVLGGTKQQPIRKSQSGMATKKVSQPMENVEKGAKKVARKSSSINLAENLAPLKKLPRSFPIEAAENFELNSEIATEKNSNKQKLAKKFSNIAAKLPKSFPIDTFNNNDSILTEETESTEIFTSEDDNYELSTSEAISSDDTDFYVPSAPKNRRKSAPNPSSSRNKSVKEAAAKKSQNLATQINQQRLKSHNNGMDNPLKNTKLSLEDGQNKCYYGSLNSAVNKPMSFGASGNSLFGDSQQPSTSASSAMGFNIHKADERMRSDSESDEWEEIDANGGVASKTAIQIELKKANKEPNLEEQNLAKNKEWEKEIRLEIARRRREMIENWHIVHFLSYIGHLRYHVATIVRHKHILSGAFERVIPPELSAIGAASMINSVEIFRETFCNEFQLLKGSMSYRSAVKNPITYLAYLMELIRQKTFQNDRDLAVLFFALSYCVFEVPTRLVVSFNPMPRFEKVDENDGKKTKIGKKPAESESDEDVSAESQNDANEDSMEKSIKTKKLKKKPSSNSKTLLAKKSTEQAQKLSRMRQIGSKSSNFKPKKVEENLPLAKKLRNYWIEYYDEIQRRWICVDPLHKIVDEPLKIEKNAAKPMTYVIGVDSDMGVRELTPRYASEYLSVKFRKLRMEPNWLKSVFSQKLLKANELRSCLEDVEIRRYLFALPKPTIVSEYKNHPLYALERDLLKFEAIYPKDVEPLGEIRGHKIYPRSCVYTLQGTLNWIREARQLKKGEQPYKIVKARPKLSVPKENRVQLMLEVYGFWQTEPYVPPEVVDGKIPRNEYGNVYMYKDSMCPRECTHLKLAGVYAIARRLDLEAVPAVIGWEFSGARNHPIIDGCIVLTKDADVLRTAWEEMTRNREEKEAKKADEKIWKNWRRLIKGKLLLEKMRSRFK